MVNALIQAIPSIFNVMLVCLMFWLIFAIIGVSIFGGKFVKCVDETSGETLPTSVVSGRNECLALHDAGRPYVWFNSRINFDTVPNAYLALFQVVRACFLDSYCTSRKPSQMNPP